MRRSRGKGKRSIESDAPDPDDSMAAEVSARRVAGPPRKAAKKAAVVQQPALNPPPPSPADNIAPPEPPPRQPDPIDAQLLSCYGGFDPDDLSALDVFFGWSTRFCEEDVIQGLLKLSVRMRVALERHRIICIDLSAANGRVDSLYNANLAGQNLIDELRAENAQMKEKTIALEGQVSTLKTQAEGVSEYVKQRESDSSKLAHELEVCKGEIESLKRQLAESSLASLACKNAFEKEKADLSESIVSLQKAVSDLQKQADGFKLLESKFVDPVTHMKHVCPVIQNNGVIRSLPEIINMWLKEPDLGQSNAFRMFQCPVLGNFSMVSPFQIVETVMNLAAAVGVKISSPVVFHFKRADDSWLEFPLHEQFELIARLCTVYSQRKNEARPPEQRNITVAGVSFMLVMRAVACAGVHRFECYGIDNRDKSRVDIKPVFEQGWDHPFGGMDFGV